MRIGSSKVNLNKYPDNYEFRENSIVVSIPFTRVEIDMNTQDDAYDEIEMIPDETEMPPVEEKNKRKDSEKYILEFCVTPRNALEIAEMLGLKEKKSARRHIKPLVI